MRRSLNLRTGLLVTTVLPFLINCCSNNKGPTNADTTPPAAVTDLTAIVTSTTSVRLEWTVPSDPNGIAAAYEFRGANVVITDTSWAGAQVVVQTRVPKAPGTPDSLSINGLTANTTYYWAMKTRDTAGNWSAISNSVAATTFNPADDAHWSDGFGAPPGGAGMDGAVWALTIYNGRLIAGGEFTLAGGTPAAHIAAFDGTTWSALGLGLDGIVRALTVDGNSLVAASEMENQDGSVATRILSWDGGTWTAIGGEFNDRVDALAVFRGDLYAGGEFSQIAGEPDAFLVRWTGTAWSEVGPPAGPPPDGAVLTLIPFGADLIVGGQFVDAGTTHLNRIGRWDGDSWTQMSGGVDRPVHTLALMGTDLYVGGEFVYAGTLRSDYIARWDGTRWNSVRAGAFADVVTALAPYGTELVAAGQFLWIDGVLVSGIAHWNGSVWKPFGSGVSGSVHTLAESGTDLFVGGLIDHAGDKISSNVARWRP